MLVILTMTAGAGKGCLLVDMIVASLLPIKEMYLVIGFGFLAAVITIFALVKIEIMRGAKRIKTVVVGLLGIVAIVAWAGRVLR